MTSGQPASEWNLNGRTNTTAFVSHFTENVCGFSEWDLGGSVVLPAPFFVVSEYSLTFSNGENSMYLGVI
jgi:hypothetical protein